MITELTCLECNKPAVCVRNAQFAGQHPYDQEHVKKEKDFSQDDSYAYWYKVEE